MEKEEIFKKTNKKKITNSFKYAFCGIITGIKNEKNIRKDNIIDCMYGIYAVGMF